MQQKRIKILEICPFSAGACGVWTRVINECLEFKKLGYEVRVFSSNIIKGGKKTACEEEAITNIKIKRFKTKSLFISNNVLNFNFKEALLKYSPDIVITHLFHPHSFKALKLCKEKNLPCYIVTHAPFNVRRNFPLNLITPIYNKIQSTKLKQFTNIIAVTKWEIPYILKLGVKKEKITYIPNGIPEEFFKQKKEKIKEGKDILFLGRISPVKNVETLIYAAKLLPTINFSIVGPAEEKYLNHIKNMIKEKKLRNIKIYPPIFNITKKIKLIDCHKIFVLPSKREAMPQVLLEAMARKKIVVSSDTDGGKEIIHNGKNGFLFKIGSSEQLAEIIKANIKGSSRIQKNALTSSKKYAWQKLIKDYISLFNKK